MRWLQRYFSPAKASPTLLTLPQEVRLMILKAVIQGQSAYLVHAYWRRRTYTSFNVYDAGHDSATFPPTREPTPLNILAVCQQLRKEFIDMCVPKLELRLIERGRKWRRGSFARANVPPGWLANVRILSMPERRSRNSNYRLLDRTRIDWPSLRLVQIRKLFTVSQLPSRGADKSSALSVVAKTTMERVLSTVGDLGPRYWKVQVCLEYHNAQFSRKYWSPTPDDYIPMIATLTENPLDPSGWSFDIDAFRH